MVYKSGSKTLMNTGLDKFDFADVQAAIAKLDAGGVEVFLSVGGWNYNCYPFFYMRYFVDLYNWQTHIQIII